MSSYVLFCIVTTLLLVVYYAVMIALDLRKLERKPNTNKEVFDVSAMREDDEPVVVEESRFMPPADPPETEEVLESSPIQETSSVQSQPSRIQEKIREVEEKEDMVDLNSSNGMEISEYERTFLEVQKGGGLWHPR